MADLDARVGNLETRMSSVEARTSVSEALVPRIERSLAEHMKRTEQIHDQAEEARAKVMTKLDSVISRFDARENQAMGAGMLIGVGKYLATPLIAIIGFFVSGKWLGFIK